MIQSRILGWLASAAAVLSLLAGAYFYGRMEGRDAERAVWTERQIIAERAARQTETDLAALAAKSAARQAQKEALLNDQAQRQTAAWRAAMARVRDVRIPRAVGVQLDAAAGVSNPSELPGAVPAGTDEKTLDTVIELSDTLDRVRANYEICRINIERLTAVRDWYNELRDRVND